MNDLIEDSASNAHEYTVSEISGAVKRTLEGEFGQVRVKGEVGRVSRPSSGHLYYDLKDDGAVIAAITWKGQAARLSVQPEEGMEVVVTGRMTTFPGQSKYQLIVDEVRVAGQGALMLMLEKRRKALAAEGLFDLSRKRQIPYLPDVIGVVTSPSGAVIRDILHRLRDRFPRQVLVWPVAVQGEKCAAEVARAIAGFNAMVPGGAMPRPDLIIVARGGGSLEDLWGFNEEVVVRAVAASDIPLISAVGHETDTTLIDFAADLRAPTPTAAAELAVPVRIDLIATVDDFGARLRRSLTQGFSRARQRVADLARALPRAEAVMQGPRQRLDRAADRLPAGLRLLTEKKRGALARTAGGLNLSAVRGRIAQCAHRLETRSERLAALMAGALVKPREQLAALERMRQTLGYTETLKRGYAVVRGDGGVVTTKAAAGKAARLEIEFQDGRLELGGRSRGRVKGDEGQGSLF